MKWDVHKIQNTNFYFEKTFDIKSALFVSIVVANFIFMYIAIAGSELVSPRYIYPAYPILALIVTLVIFDFILKNLKKYRNVVIGCICLLMCFGTIKIYGVDWQYEGYADIKPTVDSMAGADCITIYMDNRWINMYAGTNLFTQVDECVYVSEYALDTIPTLLEQRASDSPVIVAFPTDPAFSQEQVDAMMNQIIDMTVYTSYEYKYNFCFLVYELH